MIQIEKKTLFNTNNSIIVFYRSCEIETPSNNQEVTTDGYMEIGTLHEAERTMQTMREMKNHSLSLLELGETNWLQSGQKKIDFPGGSSVLWA